MAQLTKQALIVENNQSFPNNNAGAITPTVLRQFNTDIIDSTVNQSVYTADSGSWNEKIDGLSTGSALITASVDFATITFTKGDGSQFDLTVTSSVASVDWDNVLDKPAGLVSGSSQVVDILTSVNSFTASQESKDSTLASYTGSVNQKFSTIGTQSGSWDNTSLNQFSASQESKDITLASYTGSVNAKFSTIGSQSGSWDNTALNQFTQSQDITNTQLLLASNSFEAKFSTIGSQSGSWVTESETGSFARTNVANTFTETQQFGDVNVTGTANIHILNVTYESSSVIYSSGSNVFGDELTDTQTLSGSVKVVGGLTVNGINVLTESVDLGPLNAFTQSQQTINTALNASTASQQISIDALNSFTASYTPTDLGPLNSFTSSQEILNDTFATTGSNQFNGNQNIVGQLTASALRVENNTHLDGTLRVTNDTEINGDLTIQSATPNLKLRDTSGGGFSSGYDVRVDTGSFEIYDDTHNRDVLSDVFNPSTSKHTTSLTSQIVLISGSDSVTIQGNLTASLQNGYAWVGNGSGLTSQVPTSSFGSPVDLGPLNSFTQSQELLNTQLLNASTSFEEKFIYIGTQSGSWSGGGTDLTSLNAFTSSQQVLNAQFATTGSNTFEGTQTINGDLSVSNIITADKLVLTGGTGLDLIVTGSGTMTADLTIGPTGTGDRALLSQYGISNVNQATGDELGFTNNGSNYGVSGWDGPSIYGNDPDDLYPAFIGFQNKADWTDGTITVLKPLDIIGSLSVNGTINNSVNTLSITSNTASIDASVGTTFVLSLVDATNTRLEVSNTTYGQTLNLLVSQSAAGTGTLTFGENFYEPSGSFYSASAVASAKDIVTLATFVEPNVVYVASIKNLIV